MKFGSLSPRSRRITSTRNPLTAMELIEMVCGDTDDEVPQLQQAPPGMAGGVLPETNTRRK